MSLLPPKPQLHPNDNFRSCQIKVDSFYADVERIVKGAKQIYAKDGAWFENKPNENVTHTAWLIGVEENQNLTNEEVARKLRLAGMEDLARAVENLK